MQRRAWFCLLCNTLQVFEHVYAPPSKPSFLQAQQPQLSQPLLTGEMLQTFHHFCVPSLERKSLVAPSLSYWGVQNRTLKIIRAEQRGRITSGSSRDPLPSPAGHPWMCTGPGTGSCLCRSSRCTGLWGKEKLHTWTKVHTASIDTIISVLSDTGWASWNRFCFPSLPDKESLSTTTLFPSLSQIPDIPQSKKGKILVTVHFCYIDIFCLFHSFAAFWESGLRTENLERKYK